MPAPARPFAAPPPPDWQNARTVQRVIKALRARTFRKDGRGPIKLVQTHISSVFLTPRYVFKFKRAVDVGFADFRSLRSRRHFCLEEVRLNRRLAPGVYLGVVALCASSAGFALGKRGAVRDRAVVDYAVVMRRLPAERMLDARLRAGTVRPGDMHRLAGVLARFHRRLRPSLRSAHWGGLETWNRNWAENFQQTRPEVGLTLSAAVHRALRRRVGEFLDRNRALLQARVQRGFVRNGHGDLRCEHIELTDPVRIIDCVEFNERFRYGDVANDLAFLLMDLCAFGQPHLARHLLDRYQQRTGDAAALPLIPFYCCYRAFVRGKVLGMRLRDRNLAAAARRRIKARACAFFALAEAFARQMGPPVLLLVAGLMGSGKSTLAEALAGRTGMAVLSTDRIRKELASLHDRAARDRSAYGEGLYTYAWTERTYRELLVRAKSLLAGGTSVILDASFNRREHRRRAFALADKLGVQAVLIECVAPDRVTLARLRARERGGTSFSDGRAELYPLQKAEFESIGELGKDRHRVAHTQRAVQQVVTGLLARSGLHIPQPLFGLPEGAAFGGARRPPF